MLHIGLTGGIAAGKSTIARILAQLGAVVIDADVLARAVVEPGTPGLDAVVDAFGAGVLGPDGALDRAELARTVFADAEARARLNAIVHPLVREASAARVADLPPDAVVVHDIPLLVENGLGADHHLVLVVGAPAQLRADRLVADRGLAPEEARARIQAQTGDDERRRAADVWIDNTRDREDVRAEVVALWRERIVPFAENVHAGRRAAQHGPAVLAEPPQGPTSWPTQAERLLARIRRAGGDLVLDAEHIGSTSVPGLVAKDVLDLQVGVASLADADALAPALAGAGFPRVEGRWQDTPKPGEPDTAVWEKRFHGSADPARPVNLHVRVSGGPGWRYALQFRDWLRADDESREEYASLKRSIAGEYARDTTTMAYALAKEPWFTQVADRMEAWAVRTGWSPPPG